MPAPWPTGAEAWKSYAARCVAHYPLMGTDWDQHAEMMKARRNAAIAAAVAAAAAEPPLSPEEEEAAASASTLF